ncbi:OmpA family protein [Wenyingzhuangia sp. IMCC45574]
MKRLLIFSLVIISLGGYSQDKKATLWTIGLGINTVDITQYKLSETGDLFVDYIGPFVDTNTVPFFSRLVLSRYLNRSLTIDGALAYNKLKKQFGESKVFDYNFISGDLGLRYDFNNIIGETGWFDPYFKIGLGFALVEEADLSIPVFGGFGFNTWFNDRFGLNFETNFKTSTPFSGSNFVEAAGIGRNFMHHSISVVYNFSLKKDTDKDGVADRDDLCPNVKGTKELYGCPDKDGDGVIDADDKCPNVAGVQTNSGCPAEKDTDGDGIVDKLDVCPGIRGSKKTNGCPDEDRDEVADKDDVCPLVPGSKELRGCPDSDGDGIVDSEDRCPGIAGSKEFNGCSEPDVLRLSDAGADAYVKSKGKLIETVNYKFGAVAIEYSVQQKLNRVVDMLLADTSTIAGFYVEGHTDSTGSAAFNMKLSIMRAKSIVNYLVDQGVERSRLRILGYGESKPKTTNATREGRAINRRVEISVLLLSRE